MVITATKRFPHFKQSVVRSIGSSRFYRKPENRNVVPLVRYTNRRRSARKRPFILPKETKAGWPDYTNEARAAGTRPRRFRFPDREHAPALGRGRACRTDRHTLGTPRLSARHQSYHWELTLMEQNRNICLRACSGTIAANGGLRSDGVVPVAVKFVAKDVDGVHLVIGDFDACRIGVGINFGSHL